MKPHFIKLEDGSILIEWIAPDVRFCINIEVNRSESGWCYVTKDGKENDSGYLPPDFLQLLKPLPAVKLVALLLLVLYRAAEYLVSDTGKFPMGKVK